MPCRFLVTSAMAADAFSHAETLQSRSACSAYETCDSVNPCRFLFTSANVINHPILSSVHAHLGALTNFEPHSLSNNNWRRMPGAFNLDRGPCEKKENASHWWSTWECAALAHFSFFRNFQAGRMQDFTFGVWDFHADRWGRGAPHNEANDMVHQPNGVDFVTTQCLAVRDRARSLLLGAWLAVLHSEHS